MSEKVLETMAVLHPKLEYQLINVENFDPSIHQRYVPTVAAGETPASVPTPTPAPITREQREAELQGMEPGDIKAIAEGYGIPRPRSGGWAAAIPAILDREFPSDEPGE
jgi:hypothetical protein